MPGAEGITISQQQGDLGNLYDWKGQVWPILKLSKAYVFTDSPWFRDGAKTEADWRMFRLRVGRQAELCDGRNLPYDPQCLPLARSITWPEALDGFGPYLIEDPLKRSTMQTTTAHLSEAHRVLDLPATATPAEIQSAFRRKARQHHPDVGGDPDTFRKLMIARKTLLR